MTRFGAMVRRVDERIPGIDLPLLSVSQTRGVLRRSELTDKPPRADSLDVYKVCRHGEIVFNKMSIRAGAVGVAPEDGLVTYHYEVMRPFDHADARYLVYLMKSSWFIGELIQRERGIGAGDQANVRTTEVPFKVLRTVDAYLPPLDEQRTIADYLERETARIDSLVSEQEGLVAVLRERRSAVIDRAVLPIETDESWTRSALKYMLRGVDQGVSPQAESGLADEAGSWGVLKSGCVNEGVFRPQEHKRLPSDFGVDPRWVVGVGDLIVSRASGSPRLVGSAAMVARLGYQLILSDKLFRLRPAGHVNARFLYWALNSRWYRAQVEGSISGAEGLANNLPLSALRAFSMFYPPFEEQQKIAERLDEQIAKIDALISEAEGIVAVAKERRAALITAAVTGQIDVREAVA